MMHSTQQMPPQLVQRAASEQERAWMNLRCSLKLFLCMAIGFV
jgi:hypothetical protein